MKPCYSYSLQESKWSTQGDLPAQTGDETEPKGPPKLAKRVPARSRGGPRSVPEPSWAGFCKEGLFFLKTIIKL